MNDMIVWVLFLISMLFNILGAILSFAVPYYYLKTRSPEPHRIGFSNFLRLPSPLPSVSILINFILVTFIQLYFLLPSLEIFKISFSFTLSLFLAIVGYTALIVSWTSTLFILSRQYNPSAKIFIILLSFVILCSLLSPIGFCFDRLYPSFTSINSPIFEGTAIFLSSYVSVLYSVLIHSVYHLETLIDFPQYAIPGMFPSFASSLHLVIGGVLGRQTLLSSGPNTIFISAILSIILLLNGIQAKKFPRWIPTGECGEKIVVTIIILLAQIPLGVITMELLKHESQFTTSQHFSIFFYLLFPYLCFYLLHKTTNPFRYETGPPKIPYLGGFGFQLLGLGILTIGPLALIISYFVYSEINFALALTNGVFVFLTSLSVFIYYLMNPFEYEGIEPVKLFWALPEWDLELMNEEGLLERWGWYEYYWRRFGVSREKYEGYLSCLLMKSIVGVEWEVIRVVFEGGRQGSFFQLPQEVVAHIVRFLVGSQDSVDMEGCRILREIIENREPELIDDKTMIHKKLVALSKK